MLESNEVINVEGKSGRYTREFYSINMFKPVTTEYNHTTRNLENYLKNKLNRAKDITKVFKNLEKQNYTITTVKTVFMKEPCFNTEIGAIFNGNIRTINVVWEDKKDLVTGYNQTIILYIK